MKPQYLFLLSLIISCQKPKPVSQIQTKNSISENKTKVAIAPEEKFIKTDTISISTGEENATGNYVLANLLDQKADKDSIVTVKYRLDFYENKEKKASSKVTIEGWQKGSEWGASYGLATPTNKNTSFIQISFGYPACGYNQNNYLYHLKNNDLQLVYQWDSMTDSGWGSWVEFVTPNEKDSESFYCKRVSFEPDDNDEDMGMVSYSDSIVFHLSGNKWKSQLLSVKDKSYFEKKMPFNEFHNIK
jgi:hypothetical protein